MTQLTDAAVAGQAIKVLIVEDNPVDAALALQEFRRAAMPVDHRVAEDEPGLRTILRDFRPDVVLCDLALRGTSGVKAIRIVHEIDPHFPVIIVTGSVGEREAAIALHSGAVDYVLKSNLQRLGVAVLRALDEALQKRQHALVKWRLDQAHEQLAHIAQSVDSVLSSYSIPDRRFTYVSTIAERVYGYAAEEFLARPELWKEVVFPADRAAVRAATRRVFAEDHYDLDYRIERPGGEIRWINHRARLSRGTDAEPMRVDSVVIDVTPRMEAQRRLRRLSRIRDVLSAVNAAIVRLRERNELYQEVCRIAVEAGGFVNVFVVERDSETRSWRIPAFLGRSDRDQTARSILRKLDDPVRPPGLIETTMRSLLPSVKRNLFEDGFADGTRAERGVHAAGSFPLVVDGVGVGAMVCETDDPEYFDDEETELLRNLASNLSFALDLLDKQRRVNYLSYDDPLTRLPNRTLFSNRLDQALAAAKRANKSLALVLLDVARFSVLKNALGEHVGDDVLRRIADRLRESADESRVARVAGDRFALCFPMLDDLRPVAEVVTEDGIRFLEAPLVLPDRDLHVTMRAGCAVFPNDGHDAETLFQNAEAALVSAKASGTTYRFYAPELNARLAKQLDLEARLQRAIAERQFVLFYQPKIELGSARVVGFEALIRWNHPERGLVPPGEFIPLLEQTGMIIPVGRWALGEAVRQFEEWRKAGLRPPRIAVNLSVVQLLQDRLVDDVRAAVERFASGCGLDLEVTESMLMENFDASIEKLDAIRALGVELSLDDFGTGYSSLAYIHRLPLNSLKIDRSFVVDMTEAPNKTSIVTTIISLARALQLKVIAEGVETQEQYRLLQLLRCDQIQGYLVGKPGPAETAAALLATR